MIAWVVLKLEAYDVDTEHQERPSPGSGAGALVTVKGRETRHSAHIVAIYDNEAAAQQDLAARTAQGRMTYDLEPFAMRSEYPCQPTPEGPEGGA